ncbi:hypothetical protein CFC21_014630 [Triticum aestivum]|uniref:Exocyst subunit Exo70 family protein n=2 Tax=Triticum aestivum TaxID=4565 RepID=A0A9R1DV96_WHEAT|nr:hypothetical protein CFC21_014630 [Triticum aestivum]
MRRGKRLRGRDKPTPRPVRPFQAPQLRLQSITIPPRSETLFILSISSAARSMSDYVPSSTQIQALRPRSLRGALYVTLALPGGLLVRFSRSLLAAVRWLPTTYLRIPVDGADQAAISPRRVPSPLELDPAQVAALTAALRLAIVGGALPIPSLAQRWADASDSDSSDDDDEERGRADDQHLWYPLIESLGGGDACLFVSGSAASLAELTGAPGLYRLQANLRCQPLPIPFSSLYGSQWGATFPSKSASSVSQRCSWGYGARLCVHAFIRVSVSVCILSDVNGNPLILTARAESFSGPRELTDDTTRTWVMMLKITTKLVCISKRQLHEQNQESAEERFAEVAKQSLELILEAACSFSDAEWSDVHISQQLTVFDTLVDVLFNIQDLPFSGSGEVAGIINKMVNAFKGVIRRTSNDIRSRKESIIHPATFILIQVLEFFDRNRDMVQSILESGDYNTGPCSDMFDCLVSKLKDCAEVIFQEKGQRCMFFLNNTNYVLQKNCHSGLLPPSVASNLVSLMDQHTMSYLEEYWFPLVKYLDGDSLKKPRGSSLDKFTKEFFTICDSQMTWKVQTSLKERLRERIVDLIVPKYVNFLKALQENPSSWLKRVCRARSEKPIYPAPQLEEVIRGLFER